VARGWLLEALKMTRIVRYKRPPRKKKAAALEVPAIVTIRDKKRTAPSAISGASIVRGALSGIIGPPSEEAAADTPTAVVTIRRRGKRDVPDMTPEEHKRRGDGADAMFQEMKRQIAAATKERP
jgi:hypothetical protein